MCLNTIFLSGQELCTTLNFMEYKYYYQYYYYCIVMMFLEHEKYLKILRKISEFPSGTRTHNLQIAGETL